uniref:Uncharacterized protein n=1 Tax=Nelumbo nucifera TaxID=4432 RepID=A0A822Z7L5_NELNU|nr:TPA_asm: hypothetical protein HUJ06_000624 [Nelumbo nucifera]
MTWCSIYNVNKTIYNSFDIPKFRAAIASLEIGDRMNGSPKKGGHGVKFTMSDDGYSKTESGFEKETVDFNLKIRRMTLMQINNDN